MSKLSIDQKTIKDLFQDKKSDFLIPDYQRPYAWGAKDKECQQLWDDIIDFAFPDEDYSKFNSDDEYFLGTIVTFMNNDKKLEVIDGQQRLTTLMLLLRAFYSKLGNMRDANSVKLKETIEKCLWKTDELDNPIKTELKIDSQVATDNDKDEFLSILLSGTTKPGQKSNYAVNYRFFQEKIDEFLNGYPSYFVYLPTRILKNCILLPIEAESQDTALRIFSTLNNRGLALSDADIFKSEFYKYFSNIGKKDDFIQEWKELEQRCNSIFTPITGTPMDELFTRYMYYERALQGNKKSTTEALRKFYGANSYSLLKKEQTFENLRILADFWNDVCNQASERFSERVLRRLFVLNYAPNSMWTYFVSVYFMHKKDKNGMLDDEEFHTFLNKITAFIWTYAVTNPGVNALRTPVFTEMVNIVTNQPVTFNDFLFDKEQTRRRMDNFSFYNGRPITRAMLMWRAMEDPAQKLMNLETIFEIEHIYARNRNEKENTLSDKGIVEMLGNKAMLEKKINIRASDYRFVDKKKYYEGYVYKRGNMDVSKEGTKIKELLDIASSKTDFTESDIKTRTAEILNTFIKYLEDNNLTH